MGVAICLRHILAELPLDAGVNSGCGVVELPDFLPPQWHWHASTGPARPVAFLSLHPSQPVHACSRRRWFMIGSVLGTASQRVWSSFYRVSQMMKPQVVFVLGGPGAGKGTQCARIVEVGWGERTIDINRLWELALTRRHYLVDFRMLVHFTNPLFNQVISTFANFRLSSKNEPSHRAS